MLNNNGTSSSPTNPMAALIGFDTATALSMLNNNIKFYERVLTSFYKQYNSTLAELESNLAKKENLEFLQREVHTLKGLAGTIGHEELRNAAIKLNAVLISEQGCKSENFEELSASILSALKKALGSINTVFPT